MDRFYFGMVSRGLISFQILGCGFIDLSLRYSIDFVFLHRLHLFFSICLYFSVSSSLIIHSFPQIHTSTSLIPSSAHPSNTSPDPKTTKKICSENRQLTAAVKSLLITALKSSNHITNQKARTRYPDIRIPISFK